MSAWSLTGIHHRYGNRPVLAGVDLRVEPGERVALVGVSGAGKSTLARVGLGLEPLQAGSVAVEGVDTRGWRRPDWRRARTQFLVQRPVAMLHPELPVRVLLEESARLHQPDGNTGALVDEALERVDLTPRAHARPEVLSGGELRRVGIARVLLARPRLLVADEPTSGLDSHLRLGVLQMLAGAPGADGSLVLITHDLLAARHVCTRAVVLDGGRVVDRFDLRAPRPSHPRAVALWEASQLGVCL